MGLSGSKTTQSNEPSAYAKGYITPAANAAQDVFNRNQGAISDISSSVQGLIPGLVSRYTQGGSPALQAANSYTTDVLSGKYMSGNPWLERIIADTNASVGDSVNAKIGTRGLAGGSAQTQLLARELGKNETALRYGDYGAERGRMDAAVGNAAGLTGADNSNLAALLQTAGAGTQLPFAGTDALTRQIAALVGNSQTTTQKQDNTGATIGSLLSAAALAFSDERLKDDARLIKVLPDGLPVYSFSYRKDMGLDLPDGRFVGVMAQDVAQLRPWALGPEVNGFMSVDYGRL